MIAEKKTRLLFKSSLFMDVFLTQIKYLFLNCQYCYEMLYYHRFTYFLTVKIKDSLLSLYFQMSSTSTSSTNRFRTLVQMYEKTANRQLGELRALQRIALQGGIRDTPALRESVSFE